MLLQQTQQVTWTSTPQGPPLRLVVVGTFKLLLKNKGAQRGRPTHNQTHLPASGAENLRWAGNVQSTLPRMDAHSRQWGSPAPQLARVFLLGQIITSESGGQGGAVLNGPRPPSVLGSLPNCSSLKPTNDACPSHSNPTATE